MGTGEEAPGPRAVGSSRVRHTQQALFPGSSAVWIGGLVVVLIGLVLLGRIAMARTASTTGTNSVGVGAVIARANPDERTCIKDLVIPRHTGVVQVWVGRVQARRNARLEAWVQDGGTRLPLTQPGPGPAGFSPFTLATPLTKDLEGAEVCVVARRQSVDYAGASVMRLPGAPVSTVAQRSLDGVDVAVRFSRRPGDSPRVISALPQALERSTVFDPGLARLAIYPLGLLLLLGASYLVLRVAATAERHSVRRLARLATLLAFVHAAAWILLLQPFHGADESEHFAYAQHLAATGDRAAVSQTSPIPPYASSQLRLMEAIHHNSTILNPSSRLRWDPYYDREYERALRTDPPDTDGGGYTESASGHSPLYYGIIGVPYRVLGGKDHLMTSLLAMRLLNAVLAALIAGLAVLTAARLLPRHPAAAWLAGVLVALQPVFASVAAAVNNDTAVNLCGALLLFLLVKAWRDGFRPRDAIATGVVAGLLPIAKITGYALVPILGVALLVLLLDHGPKVAARWAATVAATGGVTLVVWILVLSPLMGGGKGTIVNTHPISGPAAAVPTMVAAATPTAPPPAAAPAPLSMTPLGRVEYFAQTFVPGAPIGPKRWNLSGGTSLTRWPAFQIYIERGYGLFGWRSTGLSYDHLRLILFGLAFGWALALLAVIRARRGWRSWGGGALILGSAVVAVLAFVSYAYAKPVAVAEPGEQGRYVFTAIVGLAVLLAGAAAAFRGRLGQVVVGGAVAATWVVALIAYTSALRGWYM